MTSRLLAWVLIGFICVGCGKRSGISVAAQQRDNNANGSAVVPQGTFPQSPSIPQSGSGQQSLVQVPEDLRQIPFGGPYQSTPPTPNESAGEQINPGAFQPPAIAMVAISNFPGFDFQEQEIGKFVVQNFVVANFGQAPATGLEFSLVLSDRPYTITQNNCPQNLPPFSSCVVEIKFSPVVVEEIFQVLRVRYFQINGAIAFAHRPMKGKGKFPPVALGAGRYHTCAVVNAALKCWGYNNYGQIGNGNTTTTSIPFAVPGLQAGMSGASTGTYHSCAIQNGALKCWGYNGYGELGLGNTSSVGVPTQVPGMEAGVTQVVASHHHTCAIQNGSLKCWGYGGYGNLGNGGTGNVSIPTQVTTLTEGVTAVGTSYVSTCAIQNGEVKCWGWNGHGQLGNNSYSNNTLPQQVFGLGAGVTRLSVGVYNACAINAQGTIQCWGYNGHGELGNNSTSGSPIPVGVFGIAGNAKQISTGQYHTCAVVGTEVKCWGYNGWGTLGNGTTTNSKIPVSVAALGFEVTSISSGWDHSCAGGADKVKCWGYNGHGELGNNSTTYSNTPFAIYPGF